MASLKDIAQASGVSIRTVSRVMNDSPMVSDAVRTKVLALANKMGYEPNICALSLRMGKTFEIVAVIPARMDDLHVVELGAFEYEMRSANYPVNIVVGPHAAKSADSHQQVMSWILKRSPAGVAFFPQCHMPIQRSIALIEAKDVPCVALDSSDAHVDSVDMDRPKGVYQAVKYLAEKGLKRIVYLGYLDQPLGHVSGRTRLLGYDRAMEELKLEHRIIAVPLSHSEYEGGRKAALRCLSMKPQPEAVQVYSDKMAAGVLSAFHDNGVAVPGEIAVVGFGDIEMAALLWPRLTTVAQPSKELARQAARLLLKRVKAASVSLEKENVILPSTLVVRESA